MFSSTPILLAKSSHLLHLRFKESEEYNASWLKRERDVHSYHEYHDLVRKDL